MNTDGPAKFADARPAKGCWAEIIAEKAQIIAKRAGILSLNILKKAYRTTGEYGTISTGLSEAFSCQAFLKNPLNFL